MTQSFIPQFDSNSPVLGMSTLPEPTAEQAATPLTCLPGCIADHVGDELRGLGYKQCEAYTAVTTFEPSYNAARWHVRGSAFTAGSLRTAEVGIVRDGEHPDKTVFVDPEQARELAALLLQVAREAETLARTAGAVSP